MYTIRSGINSKLVVSIAKWSAAGKGHAEEQWFNGQKWIFSYKPGTQKSWSLVNAWRSSTRDGHQRRIRDKYVFPQNLGRTEKKVQLFLRKYFTQIIALRKKAFTQITTALLKRANRVQSSLYRVKVFEGHSLIKIRYKQRNFSPFST